MVLRREIFALEPITEDQFQPASLDLRLGPTAYRVRASFLPGKGDGRRPSSTSSRCTRWTSATAACSRRAASTSSRCSKRLDLRHRTSAIANPKSSTGRLDVFTRLITDARHRVRPGARAVQRHALRRGRRRAPSASSSARARASASCASGAAGRSRATASCAGCRKSTAWCSRPTASTATRRAVEIVNGVPVRVDLQGRRSGGVDRLPRQEPRRPASTSTASATTRSPTTGSRCSAPARGGLILDPAEFYILASQEAVRVPPGYAAEMIAYDTLVGEFRVHYAGFFDPGFGHGDAGGDGSRAVLEVRSYEVPFVLEHGQLVGRLAYERLTAAPHVLYGQGARSSYQGQGIKLSKHFKRGSLARAAAAAERRSAVEEERLLGLVLADHALDDAGDDRLHRLRPLPGRCRRRRRRRRTRRRSACLRRHAESAWRRRFSSSTKACGSSATGSRAGRRSRRFQWSLLALDERRPGALSCARTPPLSGALPREAMSEMSRWQGLCRRAGGDVSAAGRREPGGCACRRS